MENKVLWAVFYNLVLFLLASSKESNRIKAYKLKKESKLWPLQDSLNESDKFEYTNGGKENPPIFFSSNVKAHNKKEDKKYEQNLSLPNNTSFVTVKNYNYTRTPSHHAYIRRDNTHTNSTNNNQIRNVPKELNPREFLFTPNNQISASLIQTNGPAAPMDILRYLDFSNSSGQIISTVYPFYVQMNYFAEIKYYITFHFEAKKNYDKAYNQSVNPLMSSIQNQINSCVPKKAALEKTIFVLENPESHNINLSNYEEKHNEYKQQLDAYKNCVQANMESYTDRMSKFNEKIYSILNSVKCTDACETDTYEIMLEIYVERVKEVNLNNYVNYLSTLKASLQFGVTLMLKVKQEIDNNVTISTINFLQEEMLDIITLCEAHTGKIIHGKENVLKLQGKEIPAEVPLSTLKKLYFDSANFYATYKFSLKRTDTTTAALREKGKLLADLYNKLITYVSEKIDKNLDSLYFISKSESMISEFEDTFKAGTEASKENSSITADYARYSNLQIIDIKSKYDYKITELKKYLNQLKVLISPMKDLYNLNSLQKDQRDSGRSIRSSNSSPQEKVSALINLLSTIKDEDGTVLENFKNIERYYEQGKPLKGTLEGLIKMIKAYEQDIVNLIDNEKHNRSYKDDIKNKIKYITEKTDAIKDIIPLNEEVDNIIKQIEKLFNEDLFHEGLPNMEKLKKEKEKIKATIKSLNTNFYDGDLKELVDDMLNFVYKHSDFYDQAYAKGDVVNLQKEAEQEYEKITKLKSNNIPQMLKDLKSESKNLSELKDTMMDEMLNNVHQDISNAFEQIRNKYKDITTSLSAYKEDKQKFEKFKVDMIQTKNELLGSLQQNDKKLSEANNMYEEFLAHIDTTTNRENQMYNQANALKENLANVQSKISSYQGKIEKLKAHTRKNYEKIKTLLQTFGNENINAKLAEYEKEFNENKRVVNTIINQIQESNKNIENIKILNNSIDRSEVNKQLIEELATNKQQLKEKIDTHIKQLNSYNIIAKDDKLIFEKTLNEEKANINTQLSDTSIDNLKAQIQEMLDYCKTAKAKTNDKDGTHLEKLDKQKMDWKDSKVKIDKLSTSYQVLDKKINDLIKKQHDEIVALIDKLITEKGNEIREKTDEKIKHLSEIKTKLSSFTVSDNVKNTQNVAIKGEVNGFEKKIEALLIRVDNNNAKLTELRGKADQHVTTLRGEKNKTAEFNAKKDSLEKIHQQMENTHKELESMENEKIPINDINQMEIEYGRILIHHMVQQIGEKKERSKSILEEINSTIESIDQAKQNIPPEQQDILREFEYSGYRDKATASSTEIEQIDKSAKTEEGKAKSSTNLSDIDVIKKEVLSYLRKATTESNTMEDALREIKNVNTFLTSNISEEILANILKSAARTQELNQQAVGEFNKADRLIKEVEAKLSQATEHKSAIPGSAEYKQIEQKINLIKQIQKEITAGKEEINTCLSNTKEYKEKCESEVNSVNRGKAKVDFLQKRKELEENRMSQENLSKITDSIDQCKKDLAEIASSELKVKANYDSIIKYEESINTILNYSSILEYQTKLEIRKKEKTDLMNYINTENSAIQEKLLNLQKKLNQLNENTDYTKVGNDLNNAKSTKANVTIQYNLGRVKHQLENVSVIKQELEKVLSAATDLEREVSKISDVTESNNLESLNGKEADYTKHIKSFNKLKLLVQEKAAKVEEISSDTDNIEKELTEHKIIFEVGLTERLIEIVKNRKSYVDTTKELLNSSLNNFASLFNGLDLKGYNPKANLEMYTQKLNTIHNEFMASHKIFDEKSKKVLVKDVNFTEAKTLREEAQKEDVTLKNKEEEAKSYLSDIKKKESFEFILHMKEKLTQISKMCEQQYEQADKGYSEVKTSIDRIANLNDENSVADVLKEANDKNEQVQNLTHYTYKNEAQNVLRHMAKSANFIGINLVTGIQPTELSSQASESTTPELKFESEREMKLEILTLSGNTTKLDYYKNMKDAYQSVLSIFKYSHGIDEKQRESQKITESANGSYLNNKAINEFKGRLNNVKSKQTAISNKIDNATTLLHNLNKIKTDDKNYDTILEKDASEELKRRRDSFNQEMKNTVDGLKLKEIQEKFNEQVKLLQNLETKVSTLNVHEGNVTETVKKENTAVDAIQAAMEGIEKDVEYINYSYDELLKKGQKIENQRYTSIRENLTNKIANDSSAINKIKKKAQQYLAYIKNNYNSIYNDIGTLNEYFDIKRLSNHDLTNVQEATRLHIEMSAAVEASEEIIADMKNEFITNTEADISALQNSADRLKSLYSNLKRKQISINQIYKKINLIKLQEIKTSANKYMDIAKLFNNVLEAQHKKLAQDRSKILQVKEKLINTEKELANLDETITLQSLKKSTELCNSATKSIQDIRELEKENNKEDKKIKIYGEKISHLINRRKVLLNDVSEYDRTENFDHENEQAANDLQNDIATIKKVLVSSEEQYRKLLENVKKNESLYSNNDTKNFTLEISKKIENVKRKISINIPESEQLLQIENRFGDIKAIINGIKADNDVDEYVEEVYKNIQREKEKLTDMRNGEQVKEAIKNITHYNDETKNKLSRIYNAFEKVKMKKKDMEKIFASISEKSENNAIQNDVKNAIEHSINMQQLLESHIDKLRTLITNIDKELIELKNGKIKASNRRISQISPMGQGKLFSTPEGQAYNNLHNTGYNHYGSGNHSRGRNENGNVRFAAGIVVGLGVCSFFASALFKGKKENETYGRDLNSRDEEFEGKNNGNLQDKEEIIEVSFHESENVY
uniref:Reticulocyte-binding protein 2a n=1 Tax=Plasmodium vivax TaxID=5855 RepID=A0A513X4K8_PLAVI|nr:reticulocyte-binding protein 2a [Plasmodium vivax]